MNLKHITGKLCFVVCCGCHRQTAVGDGAEKYPDSPGIVDLDGEPIVAFYCHNCACWLITTHTAPDGSIVFDVPEQRRPECDSIREARHLLEEACDDDDDDDVREAHH
jgi:hypothetical protein